MHRKELNERSPLRLLEKSIHGGLGRGNVGVVVARHGTGKTAFLVGVALDDLLRGKNVLHVGLGTTLEKVCAFYDDILLDLIHSQELEDAWRARRDVERGRRIVCRPPEGFSAETLSESLAFWSAQGDFRPAAIVVEGYDFDRTTADELEGLRLIAREANAELWMSAVTHRDAEQDSRGIPEPVARLSESLDVILRMAHDGRAVHVSLLKDHDNPDVSDLRLALDPRTMLLVRE